MSGPSEPARPWHSVGHTENFPVASWLVPAALRPAIVAIYHFARAADDIADEGDALPAQRRDALDALHAALHRAEAGDAQSGAAVVDALVPHQRALALQWRHFHALLDAFIQDTHVRRYESVEDVDRYCRHSADPVGRLVLEVFGVPRDPAVLQASDAVCTALQRINFLQDIASDLDRDRIYVPLRTLRAEGVDESAFIAQVRAGAFPAATRRALHVELRRARALMHDGAGLVQHVPRRLAWELRAIIAGGLRIVQRLEAVDMDVLTRRPRLGWTDAAPLLRLALAGPAAAAVAPFSSRRTP